MSAKNWTPGPLTVKVAERWPFNIETLDAEGDVIFSTRMPCNSTRDKSADDAINCVNFPADNRAKYAAINRRAVSDDVLRAAAPDLYSELERAVELVAGDLTGPEWKEACHAFVRDARAVLAKARGAQ